MAFANVDHGLNGKDHARFQRQAGAGCAVMQYLGVFVKPPAYAVAAIFAYHRATVGFGMNLNGMADIAELDAGLDQLYTGDQALMSDFTDPFSLDAYLTDIEHFAGIAMKAIFDNGDVDIDDITVF